MIAHDLRKAWTAHVPPREFAALCATIAEAPSVSPVGIPPTGYTARRLSHALQGRVAGVSVLESSGILATGARVRFRGGIGPTLPREPLLVIDGVRVDASQSSPGPYFVATAITLRDVSIRMLFSSRSMSAFSTTTSGFFAASRRRNSPWATPMNGPHAARSARAEVLKRS